MHGNDDDDENTINAGGGTEIPKLNNRGKDNCSTLVSTAAKTTTVVKVTAMAAVTTNKEMW